MTHMLIMAACQLSDPVVFLVFVIASDGLFHKFRSYPVSSHPSRPNCFRNHTRQKPEQGVGPDGHQCGCRDNRPARRLRGPETPGHGKLYSRYQQQGPETHHRNGSDQ